MAKGPDVQLMAAAVHELAEGLQATGSYLAALGRGLADGGDARSERDVLERAMVQWHRARHATRELQACLDDLERNPPT